MPIGLSQEEMNRFAAEMLALLPSECVTYKTPTGDDVQVLGHFLDFSKHELALNPMLVNMRRFRMGVDALPMAPARRDVLVRAAGTATETTWDVDSISGGVGRTVYFLTVRQVR